jgi:hypothetical protein
MGINSSNHEGATMQLASRWCGLLTAHSDILNCTCCLILQYWRGWQIGAVELTGGFYCRTTKDWPTSCCRPDWSVRVNNTRQSNTSSHNVVCCSSPGASIADRLCDRAAKYVNLHLAESKTWQNIFHLRPLGTEVHRHIGLHVRVRPKVIKNASQFA